MSRAIPRYAVVPTHNRHDQLAALIKALGPQCDHILIIDNASTPPVTSMWLAVASGFTNTVVIVDDEQPPNLSRLWNRGIDLAALGARVFGKPAWDVAVLNDDAVVPPDWWDNVSGAMRGLGMMAACADPRGVLGPSQVRIFRGDAPCSTSTRLAGWAFMLRGEAQLRADERLRWWYGDDLLSLQARNLGGLVHVGGVAVGNVFADQSTVGVLAEQAGRDRQTFIDITGRQPW